MLSAATAASPLRPITPTPSPLPDSLYVDAGRSLGPISPLVYGTNYGPWAVVRPEVQEQAETAGISYLRFPGGNWGDQNNLTEAQIDQFVTLAGRMGAEPSISVRLRGGTPEMAAALVTYANKSRDYRVRYWSIGNEPSLYPEYDTARYNAEWRAVAEAMLAVDPSIVLIGPDIHQFTANPAANPRDASGRDWLREFLRANGDLVDIVSIHRYPFPASMADGGTTIGDLRANSQEWDQIIPLLRREIRDVTGRDLPVAVTEVNSHWSNVGGGEATPDSLYNAIWWADVLGRLIRQRVEVVAHFALQSSAQLGGWGLLGRFDVRPTYYVYPLYKRFGRELADTSSDDPDLSIYAALREDGALSILVINLGPEPKTKALRLDGAEPAGPAELWRLDAEHLAEQLGDQAVENGSEITLPPQSISLYVLPLE